MKTGAFFFCIFCGREQVKEKIYKIVIFFKEESAIINFTNYVKARAFYVFCCVY